MEWNRLINDTRLGMESIHKGNPSNIRSDFQRDYDRLIFSSPFRRLQNKTQVFPLPGSVFVHNRLTHSLEVSSVGRSMAREALLLLESRDKCREEMEALRHIPDIVATACLCHDLGNPPFGHSGEKTISAWFTEGEGKTLRNLLSEREWADFANFEGNANSFRLLTHKFVGRRDGGFAMTYSSLASIVKYPWQSVHAGTKGKFGFFSSEEESFRKIASELDIPELEPGVFARHPLVYLMEAADDICYQIMDIEDAHRLGILSFDEVRGLLFGFFPDEERGRFERGMSHLDDPNEKLGYLRSNVIGVMVRACAEAFVENEKELLEGKRLQPLVELTGPMLSQAYARCSETAYSRIYNAPHVIDVDIAGHRIITYLMNVLMDAVLNPGKSVSPMILSKIPRQYDFRSPDVYGRVQAVLDHIAGMTDVYALDLFRKLNGHSLPAV